MNKLHYFIELLSYHFTKIAQFFDENFAVKAWPYIDGTYVSLTNTWLEYQFLVIGFVCCVQRQHAWHNVELMEANIRRRPLPKAWAVMDIL